MGENQDYDQIERRPMGKKRIIVVGNGMVGHNFIDTLATSEHASDFEIITFSEEPRLAYDRVQLSKYFSGSTAADLALTTEAEYQQQGVIYTLSDKVVDIDTRKAIHRSHKETQTQKLIQKYSTN